MNGACQLIIRNVLALVFILWAPRVAAVDPEVGWYWVPGEPGRGYFVELQNDTLAVGTLVYDDAGNPVWFVAAGPFDGEVFSGELLRFSGGQCLECDYQAPGVPESLGVITINFRFRSWAFVTIRTEEFWMQRHWFGTDVIVSADREQDAIGQDGPVTFPSLLGQWIFISASSKPPTIRLYNFTEVQEIPSTALGMSDKVAFIDKTASAAFVCNISEGTGSFEIPWCVLVEGELPLTVFGEYILILSVGFRDIGVHGMLAYEGDPVDFGTDRGEILITGIRIK